MLVVTVYADVNQSKCGYVLPIATRLFIYLFFVCVLSTARLISVGQASTKSKYMLVGILISDLGDTGLKSNFWPFSQPRVPYLNSFTGRVD
jgi:hypothetical protein